MLCVIWEMITEKLQQFKPRSSQKKVPSNPCYIIYNVKYQAYTSLKYDKSHIHVLFLFSPLHLVSCVTMSIVCPYPTYHVLQFFNSMSIIPCYHPITFGYFQIKGPVQYIEKKRRSRRKHHYLLLLC